MSCSLCWIDTVYLATYGLSKETAVQYFLHPSNPFRTKNTTTNDRLVDHEPHVVARELTRMVGEQYTTEAVSFENESDPKGLPQVVFVIKHSRRNSDKIGDIVLLNIYYIVDGQIFKSPTVRDVLTAKLARVVDLCVRGMDEKEWEVVHGITFEELKVKREKEEKERVEEKEKEAMEDRMDEREDEDEGEEGAVVVLDLRGISKVDSIFERLEKENLSQGVV
ncbi:hypothetical protein ScalyP_jg6344 [Parmales sp. scaly parma]|nr:hypothetical protein ScalyP_jg6344 [Parmales sp. scaly parma]